jgi:hypothetical protein
MPIRRPSSSVLFRHAASDSSNRSRVAGEVGIFSTPAAIRLPVSYPGGSWSRPEKPSATGCFQERQDRTPLAITRESAIQRPSRASKGWMVTHSQDFSANAVVRVRDNGAATREE